MKLGTGKDHYYTALQKLHQLALENKELLGQQIEAHTDLQKLSGIPESASVDDFRRAIGMQRYLIKELFDQFSDFVEGSRELWEEAAQLLERLYEEFTEPEQAALVAAEAEQHTTVVNDIGNLELRTQTLEEVKVEPEPDRQEADDFASMLRKGQI